MVLQLIQCLIFYSTCLLARLVAMQSQPKAILLLLHLSKLQPSKISKPNSVFQHLPLILLNISAMFMRYFRPALSKAISTRQQHLLLHLWNLMQLSASMVMVLNGHALRLQRFLLANPTFQLSEQKCFQPRFRQVWLHFTQHHIEISNIYLEIKIIGSDPP